MRYLLLVECKDIDNEQISEPRGADFGPHHRGDVYKSVANGIMEWWKNRIMGIKVESGLNLF